GTVAYMSPEQAAGQAVTPASDWYSVGIMLFEALTGVLPFAGSSLQVAFNKQQFEPAAPRELAAETPDDPNALCVALLRRHPEARPLGRDVIARLGGPGEVPAAAVVAPPPSSSDRDAPLIGRERHLAALRAAFDEMTDGRAVLMLVH